MMIGWTQMVLSTHLHYIIADNRKSTTEMVLLGFCFFGIIFDFPPLSLTPL